MSFRIENKIKLTKSDFNLLKIKLFENGMKNLYPIRKVNSCYFDSSNLNCYYDSEEGLLPRKKIRVRWYNNTNLYNKETKVSSIEGRFKKSEYLNFKSINQLLNHKFYDNLYGCLKPKLIVTYSREYYSFKNIRLTFDYDITYEDLRSNFNQSFFDKENVLEIKADIFTSIEKLESLIKVPSSRFSKYCRGILRTERLI
tara:strand:+ start:161 stop:757 length:597 start_codon:yes stop_codon:yes gene_type:complete